LNAPPLQSKPTKCPPASANEPAQEDRGGHKGLGSSLKKKICEALNRFVKWKTAVLAALALVALASTPALAGNNDNDENEVKFDLVRSGAVVNAGPGVLPNAHGRVKIESVGPVEIMDVKVWGLPPNTDFDFFVIQVPNGPFGLAWYQGDIETNRYGIGHGRFIGRFSIETFIVANGVAPAPLVFNDPPFPDAAQNLAARMIASTALPHLTQVGWFCGEPTQTSIPLMTILPSGWLSS
jgi:hypothetical protein